MLENDFHLSPGSRTFLISLTCPRLENLKDEKEAQRSLKELTELTRTLQLDYVDHFIQKRESPDPATILGRGKLEEIANEAKDCGVDLLIFDIELTASQIRNIKKLTGLDVVDRCHIILEIFSKHARTKEAKIQIEISRLQYLLPRLSGFWTHFSRQRGGIGVRGGEGEQQIELDRRIIRDRISRLKSQLKGIEKNRQEQRKRRHNKAITAALVGYTNAGKSSLMNRLCQVDILEEDKLFATVDATFRTLTPEAKPPLILIDTVGFLSNLPNTLIDGFKTTLESALEADLLLIVCDISDPNYKTHIEVTDQVLKELKLEDKPRFYVFNKKDQLQDPLKQKIITRSFRPSFLVSSFDQNDMKSLRSTIIDYFLSLQSFYELFVPYEQGEIHSKIMAKTNIIKQSHHEKGIFYRVRVPSSIFEQNNLKPYTLGPNDLRPDDWQE